MPNPLELLKRDVNKTLKQLNPDEQDRLVRRYKQSLGLPQGLNCGEAFSNNKNARPADAETVFGTIKLANNKTFSEQLMIDTTTNPKLAAAITGIRKETNKVFASNDAYSKAGDKFTQEIGVINQLLNQVPPKTDPGALGSYLLELKSEALDAIKKQNEAEKKALEALFAKPSADADSNYVKNLKEAGISTTDKQVSDLQKQMTEDLEKRQGEENAKFEKALEEDSKKLFEHTAKEAARVAFLATIFDKNEEEIRKLIAKRDADSDSPAELSFDIEDDKASAKFYGINLDELTTISTLTGQQMQLVDKEKHIYKMDFPSFPSGLLYYNSRDDAVLTDMAYLAAAVRASGHDSVIMKVNYNSKQFKNNEPNNDEAMEMGRKAYEGAIRAGFPPEKISIEVNGKPVITNDLFAGYGQKLQLLQNEAQKIQTSMKKYEDSYKKATGKSTFDLKKELDDIRSKPATSPTGTTPTTVPTTKMGGS